MRKQNKCYGLGNPSLILFRHSSLQNLDAERNHMHYVPFAAAGVSVAVSLRRHDGNVGVVEPMMRRRAWICAGSRRRICSPEIAQLPVNVSMRDLGSSAPFLSQPLISSAMTEAFSRESPSSSARIFVAVALLANRSSAIAPTISCPSGAYACAPGNWRAVRITDKSRDRGKRFIPRMRDNTVLSVLRRCLRRNLREFFRGVSGVSRSAIRPNKSGRTLCNAGIVRSRVS